MRGEFERPGRFEFDAGALFDLGTRPVRAAFGHDVFEAGVLAVGAVAEIAVNREHGLRNFDKFFRFEKADDIREARIGGFIAVAAAHAAAHGEVVADEPVVFDDGDEAEAIREYVLVIHRRNGKRHLEFSRQIRFAVKRVREIFVLRFFEIELLAVNPDGVIGPGLRRERQGDALAILKDLLARLGVGGRGRGEHIAVHVAARGERGEQRFVDGLDDRAQVGLEDAVELDGLARGDAHRVIAVAGRQIVEHAPLIGRHHAAGNAAADHHDVFLAGLAQVAVILLVGAVKLQELVVVLGKMIGARVVQRRGDGARERRDRGLDFLVVR